MQIYDKVRYFGESGKAASPFLIKSKASSVSLMPFSKHSTVMEQPQTIQSINGGTQMWASILTQTHATEPSKAI